jgi:3-deoxy-manno-octulosonate cytidylyltransferase (CMP-KDO synthetase)
LRTGEGLRGRDVPVGPVAVIPARYASTRFPGKPLARLAGKPMVQHVWERCIESRAFDRVVVATDDERIRDAVAGFGGEARLTSAECASGTDRVAEVARALPDAQWLVNVQGDEPLMSSQALALLCRHLAEPKVELATLIRPLDEAERHSPNVVKVVLSVRETALYFSRSDIPHARDPHAAPKRFAHVGIYAYRRDTLLRLAQLSPTPLEKSESLEQLRALENGIPIHCFVTAYRGLGVDTPEDLARAEELLARG